MSLLEIAKSGLLASQTALGITSHNVANANTAGYSRQRVRPEAFNGYGDGQGWGVLVQDISRVTDYYLTSQVWDSTSYSSSKKITYQYLDGLDRVLGSESSSISKGINALFGEISAASADPASIAYRQEVLSSADMLAQRFNALNEYIESQTRLAGSQAEKSISEVNTLIASIASYNKSIIAGGQSTAGEILDQRDQAITKLSEYIGITVLEQGDGGYNIYLQSGQPLVMGDGQFNTLAVQQSLQDPAHLDLLLDNGTAQTVFKSDPGGSIGALLGYQSEVLSRASNELGRVSLILADQFNRTLSGGADMTGFSGAPDNHLFADINWLADASRVEPVTGSAVLGVNVNDITALQDVAHYELRIVSATNYEIHAIDSGGASSLVTSGTNLADLQTGVSFNGLNVKHHTESTLGGTLQNGDVYRINFPIAGSPAASRVVEEVNSGNSQVLVVINDSKQLTISDYDLNVSGGVYTITRQTDGTSWSGAVADLDSGVSIDGFTVAVRGSTLANGDQFVLQPTRQGAGQIRMMMNDPRSLAFAAVDPAGAPPPGDNSNLEKLLELQSEQLIEGNSTLMEGFIETVGYVGVLTAQAKVESETSVSLLEKATLAKDSVSAVNLDEEAVNLIRFQQSYDANARVITVSQKLFDTLLAMF